MPYDTRHVAAAFLGGIAVTYTIHEIANYLHQKSPPAPQSQLSPQNHRDISHEQLGIESTIGNTPLIVIKSLSEATGCTILAKCEFLNGAGNSPKDRVALSIINRAEAEGLLAPYSGKSRAVVRGGTSGMMLSRH